MEAKIYVGVSYYETIRNISVNDNSQGYNGDFLYPSGDRGAKAIPEHLSRNLNIHYNSKVEEIDLRNKTVKVNGKLLTWDTIVSTIPLNVLLTLIKDIDGDILKQAAQLKSSRGLIINIGVKKNVLHEKKSWVYFSDMNLYFYRIGFYSNIQPLLAPEGYSSMYVECSPLFFNNREEAKSIVPEVINQLIHLNYITNREDIVVVDDFYLEQNYCIPNQNITDVIHTYLKQYDIYSIGRYGTWHWSSQHEDMQQACHLAQALNTTSLIPT